MDNLELQVSPTEGTVPLGRTAFRMLVEHLTKTQRSRKSSVGYVLGTLVYDNLSLVRRVAWTMCKTKQAGPLVLAALEAAKQHVKFSYLVRSHQSTADDCIAQCQLCFGPGRGSGGTENFQLRSVHGPVPTVGRNAG